MTKYRGYQIEMQRGKRDVWYNVTKDGGEVLHRAATEHAAMQWIDAHDSPLR